MIVPGLTLLVPLVAPGLAAPIVGIAQADAPAAAAAQESDANVPPAAVVQEPASVVEEPGGPVTEDERAEWSRRERDLLRRIAELETALRDEQARSLRRQQQWIEFTRVLQSFELPAMPEPPDFIAEALAPAPDPVAEAAARERERLLARAERIDMSLKALLTAEGVRGIDVLEVGLLHEHEGRTWTGPVIARLLDERGRMIGMLKAARLRIETSRASRTVTLLFEEGYESRSGRRSAFDGGVLVPTAPGADEFVVAGGARRIFLGTIDPAPWIEALPELIDPAMLEPFLDDGLWDLSTVRVQIARLLRDAAAAGDPNWRLVAVGGIRGDELRDVQMAELDALTGRPNRRVFADAARISTRDAGGVEIQLEGGTVRRGDRVAPFLAGRYRILLPRADAEAWLDARLPGLAAPPLPQGEVESTTIETQKAETQKAGTAPLEAQKDGDPPPPVR